jgi:hypothetical protein
MTGCGGGSGSGVDGSGSGASGNGKGANASGGSLGGPDLQFGGTSNASGATGAIDECAGELLEAKYVPLDMYIMLDKSGSMLDVTESDPNQTKWQAVSAALASFVSDPESAGIGVGLQLFPLLHTDAPASCTTDQQCGEFGPCLTRGCWPPQQGVLSLCATDFDCGVIGGCVEVGQCANDTTYVCNHEATDTCDMGLGACQVPASTCLMGDDCRPASYATPAAAIAELPGAEAGLLDVIGSTEPDGLTPSGPALTGAIQQTREWALAHPERQVVAVLATDGIPTLQQNGMVCEPITLQSEIDAVAQIAADGRAGTPSVSTFVIGVMGPNDIGGPETLSAIATAGGTGDAFIVDTQGDVAAQFRDALDEIRGSQLSCDLLIPEPEVGKMLDYDQVNVTFDDGSGPQDLFKLDDRTECDTVENGWYYDPPPAQGAPERIVACPDTCAAFREVSVGSVQIKLGCASKTPVK